MVKIIPDIYYMLLIHPIHKLQVADINRQLLEQSVLYNEAMLKDAVLSVKKEIRIRIRELQYSLNEISPQAKKVD